MKLLENKTAIITGGSRGIGKAICESYAQAGADIVFTYRSSKDAAETFAETLRSGGTKVLALQSDAADYAASEELVKACMDEFGRIDVLVNNAGITQDNLLMRMSEEQWDKVIQVNLKSVFNLTKHCLRPMLKQRSGSIINMTSVVGVFGNAGQSNYSASKAGIIGFTKSIAKELGSRNIRSNAIAPGFIATDMTEELDEKTKEALKAAIPLKRLGSGTDVANAALYLASDMSTYVSGQVLSVCGAMNT